VTESETEQEVNVLGENNLFGNWLFLFMRPKLESCIPDKRRKCVGVLHLI